jgi:hypothetical protein
MELVSEPPSIPPQGGSSAATFRDTKNGKLEKVMSIYATIPLIPKPQTNKKRQTINNK